MLDNEAAPEAAHDGSLTTWLAALERRHLADLRFAEVTRALRALSTDYVHRRERVRQAALDGRGKRAAFALFFGPLHFMLVSGIGRALRLADQPFEHVTDLGCGTGAAGAAMAAVAGARSVTGIDRHPWALEEAAWTYRHFGLRSRTIRASVVDARPRGAIVAAYTLNELTQAERTVVLPRLLEAAKRGSAVLIVEPVARSVAPWWKEWRPQFERAGGRADEWRFVEPLPDFVRALDRAAGLDHREQTARSLWIAGRT